MSLGSELPPHSAAMTRTSLSLLSQPPPPRILPTVTQACDFLATFFPCRPRDVQWIYHTPRYLARYHSPDSTSVSRVICSITPTPGVYAAMQNASDNRTPPLAFLHRPFTLDRKRLPRGACVLSSHVAFDEVLTVGWNVVLAQRLGMRVHDSVCLQGYKGDPERRIGIVAALHTPLSLGTFADGIKREFGRWDAVHGATLEDPCDAEKRVTVVAIMNAFHPEEVQRVCEAAFSRGWVPDPEQGDGIVYLTGQAREPGLIAALEKNMKVFCVGHRSAEEWGIRYLASELRREFPMLDVQDIYEDEEPREPKQPREPRRTESGVSKKKPRLDPPEQ